MTLPDERYRSVRWAREFMYELVDPKKTPGVPKRIRDTARSVLRHYPTDWDMTRACDSAPDIFQEQMEAVTRLFQQYENSKNDRS
jgi:hypothetical protein